MMLPRIKYNFFGVNMRWRNKFIMYLVNKKIYLVRAWDLQVYDFFVANMRWRNLYCI